jgi:hypothetical protein
VSRPSSDGLLAFIVRAKAAAHVGDGAPAPSSRQGSHDLRFVDGDLACHDSVFGGSDFAGQEVVCRAGLPVWVENYCGRILDEAAIDAATAGQLIRAGLGALCREGRFPGGFEHRHEGRLYQDPSDGDERWFSGREAISRDGREVCELRYHGGLVRD